MICLVISFLVSLFATIFWIKAARKAGLVGKDMNKYEKPEVAEAGGIAVVVGILAGFLAYIAIKTFYFHTISNLVEIFAIITVFLIVALIGFTDDILGWRIGLGQWKKPVLCLLASIPLVVINAGHTEMSLPFFGNINFGLFYPLVLVPIAVMCAANVFNMLAGYNGLESGLGIIMLATLGIIVYPFASWITILSFCAVFSLLGFLFFNKFPAKVFPGNVLTYGIGALAACIAIVGNMEKATLILFLPFIMQFFLKARGKMKKESFALPKKDNGLELRYKKIYGLEHFAVVFLKKLRPSHKTYEKEVVGLLLLLEIIFVIIAFVV